MFGVGVGGALDVVSELSDLIFTLVCCGSATSTLNLSDAKTT